MIFQGLPRARSSGSDRRREMEPTPSQEKPKSESESLADLSLEHLPQPPPAAEGHWPGFDTASSSEVVRRYEHGLSAREKRSKRASAEKAERLFRDGLLARLWVIPNKGT